MAKLLVAKSETQGIFAHTDKKANTWLTRKPRETATNYINRCFKSQKRVKKVFITEKAAPIKNRGSRKLPKTVRKKDPNNTSPVARPWKKSNSSSKASAGQKWQICTKLNSSLWEIESYCSNGSKRYLPLQGQ